MYPQTEINESRMNLAGFAKESEPLMVEELRAEHEAEVMDFLRERPIHTFGMAGFIRTNGLVSSHNRGSFYACRDKDGQLQGVALIGHYMLLEARSEAVIEAFARRAQDCRDAHMLLGEQDKVEAFWNYYAEKGQEPRLVCRELLLEQSWPIEVGEPVPGLRLATVDDLDLIVPAHAQLAFDESGINPLTTNPDAFRQRCARRIQEGQTWVWVEEERLMFKADVITDTPEVVYLEGVWVDPAERGKGNGFRCMSQLSREFLMRTRRICLLVNESFDAAQRFYKKAGFKVAGYYDTIFLKRQKPC
jgi:ribosomal protein S18 acetylase RimI-like enzyme